MGRVRNDKTGTIRKPGVSTRYGHLSLVFWDNRQPHTVWVHRAVLHAFVGPPPEGHEARHLNGDASDNRLDNLAWGTAKENSDDRLRHGTRARGSRMGTAKLTELDVLEIFFLRSRDIPASQVAMWHGVLPRTIRDIWNGKTWGWLTGA